MLKSSSFLAVLVIGSMLSGCAARQGAYWYRGDVSADQARIDLAGCNFEAERALAAYNTPGTTYARSAGDAIAKGVMAGLDVSARKDRVISSCMPAKGYVLRQRGVQDDSIDRTIVATASPLAPQPMPASLMDQPRPAPVIVPSAAALSTAQPGGQWAYAAEKAARAASCTPTAMAMSTAKGPGFETYAVPCAGGDVATLRCELGQCRLLK